MPPFFTEPFVIGPIRLVFWEVLYVIVLVLVLSYVLDLVLYKPILRVLDERRRRLDAARVAQETSLATLEERTKFYEESVAAARRRAGSQLDAARQEADGVRHEKLDEARKTAEGRIAMAKEAIERATRKAEHDLRAGSAKMARDIASKILGREVA